MSGVRGGVWYPRMIRKFVMILLCVVTAVTIGAWLLSFGVDRQWKWQPTTQTLCIVNVGRGELHVGARFWKTQPRKSVVTTLREYRIPGLSVRVQELGTRSAATTHETRWSVHVSFWFLIAPVLGAWCAYACVGPWCRRRRRRRGLCEKCGYDLTGNESGVCPECGPAVHGRAPGVLAMTWLWPDSINPDLGLSKGDRKTIHRAAWKLWWKDKRNVLVYSLLPATYLLLVLFAGDIVDIMAATFGAGSGVQKLLRGAAPAVLAILLFVIGGAVLQRYRFAPCVYRATRDHGHHVCLGCGYWLKGLGDDTTRCPECGTSIERG